MKKIFFLILFLPWILYSDYIMEPVFNEATYVKTYGDKNNEAIVFVHGLGDEASTIWLQTVEELKKEYFILIFDLPGFGKSDKSNNLYSPQNYAELIDILVDNLIEKPFHLIGHSMGASISLKYASMNEEKIKSLVLIDAAGILNKVAYSKFLIGNKTKKLLGDNSVSKFTESLPQVMESILPINLNSLLNSEKTRKLLFRSNPTTIAATALVQEDFSLIPRILRLNTLIIWGEKDDVAPIRTGYVLNKLIQNSKLNIYPNSKHVPIVDNYSKYIKDIKSHLKNNEYKKVKKDIPKNLKDVYLKNKENIILSGRIKDLEIVDSKGITIKDAIIEELLIVNSDVKIINSELNLKKKSYVIESNFEITASDVNIHEVVELYDSKIDIAGTNIKTYIPIYLKNLNKFSTQDIVFSLSEVNNVNMHKIVNIK